MVNCALLKAHSLDVVVSPAACDQKLVAWSGKM
jgi:hypothetical protein